MSVGTDTELKVLQVIGVFFTSWMGYINIHNSRIGSNVPMLNIILMSIGIVFICLRFIF